MFFNQSISFINIIPGSSINSFIYAYIFNNVVDESYMILMLLMKMMLMISILLMMMMLMMQVRIGMDLTKIVLPTFILERRSLLEMYADFFAHPDIFVEISEKTSPEDRMVQVRRLHSYRVTSLGLSTFQKY